ncbi:MAG: PQQ-binding-like beta-propeller repeat protein, partial [Myxococcales bacterium]
MTFRSLAAVVVSAVSLLGGCQSVPAVKKSAARAPSASEKVFHIDWWTQVGEGGALPYKPIEAASPAFDPISGNVFVGTSDGKLHALAPGGKRLWEFSAGGPFNGGPTFLDGRVYVGSSEGRLVALDAAGIPWAITPGITSASAAAATI